MLKLKPVYARPENAIERDVRDALDAYSDGQVSPELEAALANLREQYENQASLADVEAAERRVSEAWFAYKNPAGAVRKDGL